jgi:hypothetical protein
MVLAVAAEWGPWVGIAAGVGAAAAGLWTLVRRRPWWPAADAARTAVAVVALVGAIDLILHGILGT